MRSIKSLQDVVDWQLCTGCGACAYACTENAVTLVNIENVGIRPRFDSEDCASCTKCLPICPGYLVDREQSQNGSVSMAEAPDVGPALEIWEGYATDPEVRFKASSGGILSALALYCLEQEKMEFVLHTGMDETKPWTNRTIQSRNRADILSRAGSRYAPASPCDGLKAIDESPGPCVFIGKPCDAAAVTALRKERPELSAKLGLVLSFFCAGTPSTRGTIDLLKSLDVVPQTATNVRYRGEGWPGKFKVQFGSPTEEKSLSYMESWGRVSSYRPLRCHLCPDGVGSTADISCGDAWQEFENDGNRGLSIVVARTRRGQEILHRAIAANYVTLQPSNTAAVIAAQPNLVQRQHELFGRLLAMKLLLVPSPKFRGFSLFRLWMAIPFVRKIETVLGTMRRLIFRRMLLRRPVY
jgi:coenzyme F420 hydrogenase subunit beta